MSVYADDYSKGVLTADQKIAQLIEQRAKLRAEVEQFKHIRDLLVKSLIIATGDKEINVLEGPMTCAQKARTEVERLNKEVRDTNALFVENQRNRIAEIDALKARAERAEAVLREMLDHFTPEHLDAVTETNVGTKARAAIDAAKGAVG